jgi:hypothetical protein
MNNGGHNYGVMFLSNQDYRVRLLIGASGDFVQYVNPERRPQPERRISRLGCSGDASLPGALWVQHDSLKSAWFLSDAPLFHL